MLLEGAHPHVGRKVSIWQVVYKDLVQLGWPCKRARRAHVEATRAHCIMLCMRTADVDAPGALALVEDVVRADVVVPDELLVQRLEGLEERKHHAKNNRFLVADEHRQSLGKAHRAQVLHSELLVPVGLILCSLSQGDRGLFSWLPCVCTAFGGS
jgi:hypothetical protein